MQDWIGKTLGRVRIESLIARGGMAEVYLGTHTTLQREVAVKILRNPLGEDRRPLERFEREAQAVAKLRHPNIVQVFDFDTVDDQPYIVMEFIRGPSLSKYLTALHAKSERMGLPQINRLLDGVASALQYAHEGSVVHRDVKPGNILLTSRSIQINPGETIPLDFQPVLTDFGLVRLLNSTRQTTVGHTAGTPAYMSPEQAMGLAVDGRTDIYSLGIVLYEMLSGDVPFDGESTMSVLFKHLNEAPAPIPGLSPALQKVLDRALAKTADDRFQEPKEFSAAFDAALEETADASTVLSILPVAPTTKEKQVAVPPRPRNFRMPAILITVLIALLGTALFLRGILPFTGSPTATAGPPSVTPAVIAPISLGPTGVLQFHDGKAILDQATLIAEAMPRPPADSQYEIWLVSPLGRLSLGILAVDDQGRGKLIFDDRQATNLLADYSRVEVTLNGTINVDTNSSTRVAYAYALPEAAVPYLRGLMVSHSATPDGIALIHGLKKNAELMDAASRDLLSRHQSGDEAGVKKSAESILNILVGEKSQDHKDWDGNGQIDDPGDGYGFLRNADNLGYIQAVYSEADYAVNASGSSRNIIVNGERVKICTQNLAGWAPELRNTLLTILNGEAASDPDAALQRSAALVDIMLNGIDLDENGSIDPVSGECGVIVSYEHTYRMADMPLLPVNPLATPTGMAVGSGTPSALASQSATSFIFATATPTARLNRVPTNTNVPPTNPPPQATQPPPQPTDPNPPNPTHAPRPTRPPKPTKTPRR